MISEDLEYVIESVEEDDIYLDPLSKLVERFRMRSELEDDVEMMHILHQVVLVRTFTKSAFFEELNEEVKTRLDSPDAEEKTPVAIRALIKTLNGIDLEDAFEADYGFVDRSAASDIIAASMGAESSLSDLEDGDQNSESVDQLLNLFVNVLQEEYDSLDQEYRERIQEMLEDIKHKSEDAEDPISATEEALRGYNAKWHSQAKGWPK